MNSLKINIFLNIRLNIGLVLVIFSSLIMGHAQGNEIKDNGYNAFYYPNGQISSEGMMKNGKPDGYWKTYYVTGIQKSEGNRKNFVLDSIWIFYDVTGDTLEKINYMYGKKNGYYYKYNFKNKEITSINGNIISKELYLNDKKEGPSFYYYDNGRIKEKINFVDGKKQGLTKEFSEEGTVITLLEYHNGYLISREKINRKDKNGLKQGMWKEFYEDGKIRTERFYKDDVLHGYYKEFDDKGNLVIAIRYDEGMIVEENVEDEQNVEIRNIYDSQGNLIESGPYRNKTPVGIHREYTATGEIKGSKIFDDFGKILSVGIVDEKGQREGQWKNFYLTGEIRSEGNYAENKREGKWNFYFKNGKMEQTGNYRNGKASGTWKWYYSDGNLHREEEYFNGLEDGVATEYSRNGEMLSKGDFLEGEKEGKWFYKVGDHTEEGDYVIGLREGVWKHYYSDRQLKYQGNYSQGNADGKHKIYWENGSLNEERYYSMGIREKTWKKYNKEGILLMTITYKNDVEHRINGIRVNLPESDVKLIK